MFPYCGEDIVKQVHKVPEFLSNINQKRILLRYIIKKSSKIKDKDKVLKAARDLSPIKDPSRHMHTYVYCDTLHNSNELEPTELPINDRLNNGNVVHIHHGI